MSSLKSLLVTSSVFSVFSLSPELPIGPPVAPFFFSTGPRSCRRQPTPIELVGTRETKLHPESQTWNGSNLCSTNETNAEL